jgi:hypothetical protein
MPGISWPSPGDILRLRRCKIGIINGDFLAALQSIHEQLVPREDYEGIYGQKGIAGNMFRRQRQF